MQLTLELAPTFEFVPHLLAEVLEVAATHPFRVIHGLIGASHEGIRARAIFWEHRQTDARAHEQFVSIDDEGFCHRTQDSARDQCRIERSDDRLIRSSAVLYKIPCITTAAAASATIQGLEWLRRRKLDVRPIQDYHEALDSNPKN